MCLWCEVTGQEAEEETCLYVSNLTRWRPCGNTSSIVYRCVLAELYPSFSPLGSCSHGRRAATSGTAPVAHIKEYEGCVQPACNWSALPFPSFAFRDLCCILGWTFSIHQTPSLHHYSCINQQLCIYFLCNTISKLGSWLISLHKSSRHHKYPNHEGFFFKFWNINEMFCQSCVNFVPLAF